VCDSEGDWLNASCQSAVTHFSECKAKLDKKLDRRWDTRTWDRPQFDRSSIALFCYPFCV